jgi:enamine deaminase RidA (YjgF/YER057c/UK114 family)
MLKRGPKWGDLFFLTWIDEGPGPDVKQRVQRAYDEIGEALRPDRDVVLQERIYGSCRFADEILEARKSACDQRSVPLELPPTFIEGSSPTGAEWTGVQIVGARTQGATSKPVLSLHGTPCGQSVTGRDADYLSLSDVARAIPHCNGSSPEEVTRLTFSTAVSLLESSGWMFDDVVRTWFYLDDILEWYDRFNHARNQSLQKLGVFDLKKGGHLPASTGISGRSAWGTPCTLDLLALRPRADSGLSISRLFNPKQNEAPEYGSAFSRGQTVATRSASYIFASGTAAIGEDGRSLHGGDFTQQTETTIDTVESLLSSAGAGLGDIVQGTAFIKYSNDEAELRRILELKGLGDSALLVTVADVCREDLLFELDATAVLPAKRIGNG